MPSIDEVHLLPNVAFEGGGPVDALPVGVETRNSGVNVLAIVGTLIRVPVGVTRMELASGVFETSGMAIDEFSVFIGTFVPGQN